MVLNNLIQQAKLYTAEVMANFQDGPLSLTSVTHDSTTRNDMVTLTPLTRKMSVQLALQELLRRTDWLARMHALDVTILCVLAEEEKSRQGDKSLPPIWAQASPGEKNLACFSGIEKQIFSQEMHRHMVLLSEPNTGRQTCLSVRDFANDTDLVLSLRALSDSLRQ